MMANVQAWLRRYPLVVATVLAHLIFITISTAARQGLFEWADLFVYDSFIQSQPAQEILRPGSFWSGQLKEI